MLADILLTLSGATFVTVLLDVLLSEGQKKTLTGWLTVVWYYADQIRQVDPVLAIFRNKEVQLVLISGIIFPLLLCEAVLIGYLNEFAWMEILIAVYAIVIAIYGRRTIAFVLSPTSWRGVALRGVLLLFFAILAAIILAYSAFLSTNQLSHGEHTQIGILMFAIAMWVGLFSALFFLGPIVLVSFMSFLLAALEYAIRRVAEYPKGPIIAGSAILTGLSALLKAFG